MEIGSIDQDTRQAVRVGKFMRLGQGLSTALQGLIRIP